MTAVAEYTPEVSESEADEYFLLIEDETFGPYTLEQVHDLWFEKQVPLDTLYVRRGMPQVRPLNEVINQVIACRKPEPEAEAAPAPQPEPPAALNPRIIALGVLLLAGFSATLYGINTIFLPAQKDSRLVQTEIQVSPVQIRVRNNDSLPWTDKLVRLNDDRTGAYEFRIHRLDPGATATVPLVNFTDGQRKHFQPWGETVTGVWVGGNGHDFRRTPLVRQ